MCIRTQLSEERLRTLSPLAVRDAKLNQMLCNINKNCGPNGRKGSKKKNSGLNETVTEHVGFIIMGSR